MKERICMIMFRESVVALIIKAREVLIVAMRELIKKPTDIMLVMVVVLSIQFGKLHITMRGGGHH
jgi:hypothetical protein